MLKTKPIFDEAVLQLGQIYLVTDKQSPEQKVAYHGFLRSIAEDAIVLSCYKTPQNDYSDPFESVQIKPEDLDETNGIFALELVANPPAPQPIPEPAVEQAQLAAFPSSEEE